MSKRQSPSESGRRLYEVASTQGGFFTAMQARTLGYSNSKQHYHVRAGNWIRECRGIYRLALYPDHERPDLLLWWLWSHDRSGTPQGVYSHQTALTLFELTDLNPAKLDMTVPKGFRRSVEIPRVLRLHFDNLQSEDISRVHDVPVTRPLRSLLDLIKTGEVPLPILREGFRDAMRRGLISPSEIDRARRLPEMTRALKEIRRRKAA